jgi:hypothetical protein
VGCNLHLLQSTLEKKREEEEEEEKSLVEYNRALGP